MNRYFSQLIGSQFRLLVRMGGLFLAFSSTALGSNNQVWEVPDGDVAALSAALEAAQEGDTIVLSQNGLYTLTEVNNEWNGMNGLPVIRKSLFIEGSGATIHRSPDALPFRILAVDAVEADLFISDLTIGNGHGEQGGGLFVREGNVTLLRCTFLGNSANAGGGVYSLRSHLSMQDCLFMRNEAGSGGGAASFESESVLLDCAFIENRAQVRGGGLSSRMSHTEIQRGHFEGNETFYHGGGIAEDLFASSMIRNTTFKRNIAIGRGGGMYSAESNPVVMDSLFEDNWAYFGGGMANDRSSQIAVAGTTFDSNWAFEGGGVYNSLGSASFTDCFFAGNRADAPETGVRAAPETGVRANNVTD